MDHPDAPRELTDAVMQSPGAKALLHRLMQLGGSPDAETRNLRTDVSDIIAATICELPKQGRVIYLDDHQGSMRQSGP